MLIKERIEQAYGALSVAKQSLHETTELKSYGGDAIPLGEDE
jgi:hypothetical protein